MKVDIGEDRILELREVFNGVRLITSEGNAMDICMRDDTFEFAITPTGNAEMYSFRVDMSTCTVSPRLDSSDTPDKTTTKILETPDDK